VNAFHLKTSVSTQIGHVKKKTLTMRLTAQKTKDALLRRTSSLRICWWQCRHSHMKRFTLNASPLSLSLAVNSLSPMLKQGLAVSPSLGVL